MTWPVLLVAAAAVQQVPLDARPGANIVDRTRADRAAQPNVKSRVPIVPPTARIATQGAPVPITGIRFIGANAPARVAAAARTFLGQPATRETLQRLAADLSTHYGASNVALYTVAIPEQDFSGGVVVVSLTEGRIAAASIKGDAARFPLLRARMAPLLGETPLTRKTFERQVTLMNAIPGVTIDTDFRDPDANGALALTVTPKRKHRKVSVGFSNRGVDLLGSGQFDAKADFYGLARDGDHLSFAASAASDFRRYRYASAAYAVPLTASGLSVTASGAYLETRPRGVPLTGRAKLAGVTLAYPLVRDFHHSADVSLGIDGLDSDNALFGNLIATERTRAVRAAASWTVARTKRSILVAGSLSKGVDVFGARVTAPTAETGFLKGTATLGLAQQIGKRMVARVTASGQYSADRLPAAERFSIGGEAIGRAFDTAILTGDKGAGGLAELAYRPLKTGRLAQSEVYGFADGGVIGVRPRGVTPGADYSLASAGIGVRARYLEKAELGLEAAHSVDDPYPGYNDDWRISVAWRLSL